MPGRSRFGALSSFNVTANPTAAWVRQQLREVFFDAPRIISEFLDYYHRDRCHLSLNKDSPEPRPVQTRPSGNARVIAIPRVSGIHHRYEWRDAA